MRKVKGFLMAESIVALIIATVAVSCMYLMVAESQENGREIEQNRSRLCLPCFTRKQSKSSYGSRSNL